MGIQNTCVCDNINCNNYLTKNNTGFAIVGNIHVTNPDENEFIGGGLVGNNLNRVEERDFVEHVSYYCKQCMIDIIEQVEK
jgi:hypothetical protein